VSAPWPPLDWACVDVPGGSLNYVEVFSLLMRVSRGTGGRWSDRAKAAYKSWQDYIIAVTRRSRRHLGESGDLWCGVVHDGVCSNPACSNQDRTLCKLLG